MDQIPAKAGEKAEERARLRLRRPEAPNSNHAPAPYPTADSPEAGPVILPPRWAPPRARDRSGAFLPRAAPPSPHRHLALVFVSEAAAAPRHRSRSFQGLADPRLLQRPGRPAPSPQAPARPLYSPRPLPRQRGLRGPLLLILSRRHRPSVAETGTSSGPGRCLHKGAAPPPSALGPPGDRVQRQVALTPLPPCLARGGVGGAAYGSGA